MLAKSCLSTSKFGFHTHSTLNGFLFPKYNHAYMGQHSLRFFEYHLRIVVQASVFFLEFKDILRIFLGERSFEKIILGYAEPPYRIRGYAEAPTIPTIA